MKINRTCKNHPDVIDIFTILANLYKYVRLYVLSIQREKYVNGRQNGP